MRKDIKLSCFSILQVMKSWVGPGNDSSSDMRVCIWVTVSDSLCLFLQDSEVFSSVDSSEYICDLWRNPDHLTKENLSKFENVSYSYVSVGSHVTQHCDSVTYHGSSSCDSAL